jgi:hypothetical protein
MTGSLSLEAIRSAPPRDVVLRTQGIPEGHRIPERVEVLVETARELYQELARPTGVMAEISVAEFREVYEGGGRNAASSPLPEIAGKADRLALFAATLGEPISRKIDELFRGNDAPLGCMLDGIASERADSAANLLGRTFLESLLQDGEADSRTRVLPYSPGYCGWHITGQKRLFAFLDPGRIDIELNASCLMSPIKSVSGVLVAGPPPAHAFRNDFDFCLDCATWECRERIAATTQPLTTKFERSREWKS